MTKPTVYLETSVIGYATSRIRRDLVVAARQQITREWFFKRAHLYSTYISQIVVNEISLGDPEAVQERLAFVKSIPRLESPDVVGQLTTRFLESRAIPPQATDDAIHIAVAAANGVEYLLTWDCRHIANARKRDEIEGVCTAFGFVPPVICTPEELNND